MLYSSIINYVIYIYLERKVTSLNKAYEFLLYRKQHLSYSS